MKTLRWIFGFPLAAAIAFGFLYVSVTAVDTLQLRTGFSMIQPVLGLTAILADLAAWVFLTCLFIPTNKRVAGIFPSILIIAFTGWLVWYIFNNRSGVSRANSTFQLYFAAGMAFSPFIGYGLSYFVFKDKGWRRAKAELQQSTDLAEIYEHDLNNQQ